MSFLITLLKFSAVMVAAATLGSMFLAEHKKAVSRGDPWYRAYFTLPGILVLVALLAPLLYWFLSK